MKDNSKGFRHKNQLIKATDESQDLLVRESLCGLLEEEHGTNPRPLEKDSYAYVQSDAVSLSAVY